MKEVEELGYDSIPSGVNFIVKLLMLPQIYKEDIMYQDQVIDDIACAIQLISLSDHQLARSVEESVASSKQPSLVCDVCNNTVIKSLHRPTHLPDGTPVCCDIIWNQTICPSHLSDGTPICFGCMRLKTSDVTYINLGDGREICPDCCSTAIFDIGQCEHHMIPKCHEFFRTLNMDIPDNIPVFLVDTKEMTRLSCEQGIHTPFGISLAADDDMRPITGVTSCLRKGTSIVVEQQPHDEYRTGACIAILFGLPKIMTQAILAHEMMHVWFRSKGVGLEGKLEEGMCQVIGRKWLDWLDSEITSSSTSTSPEKVQFLRNLVETYKFVVEMHGSYEYGEGFREVQWAVARFGLETTINHMITGGKLPEE